MKNQLKYFLLNGYQEYNQMVMTGGASSPTNDMTSPPTLVHLFNNVQFKYLADLDKFKELLSKIDKNPTQHINATEIGYDNGTALMYACKAGLSEMVQQLINLGANIEIKDKNGSTALFYAIDSQNEATLKILLDNDADVNVRYRPNMSAETKERFIQTETALQYAVARAGQEFSKVTIPSVETIKSMPSYKIVILLLTKIDHTNINTIGQRNETALHIAVNFQHIEIIKLLLNISGIDVNLKTNQKHNQRYFTHDTPLIHAIEKSNIDIVNLLLEHGANPNMNNVGNKSTHLLTAINQAIHWYTSPDIKFKIIKALVEKGANVMTPKDGSKFTPLLIAIQKKELQIANFLLSRGANPYATVKIDESESRSPYSYLQDTIIKDLEKYIKRLESPSPNLLSSLEGWQKLLTDMKKSRGTYSPTNDMTSPPTLVHLFNNVQFKYLADLDKFKELLSKIDKNPTQHINATEIGYDNGTALMYACKAGLSEMVQQLINLGANIEIKDKNGSTALFYAIDSQNEATLKILLDNDADVNVRYRPNMSAETKERFIQTETALQYAVAQAGNLSIVKLLLTKIDNTNINTRGQRDETALHIAVNFQHIEIIKLLLNISGIDVNLKTNQKHNQLYFTHDTPLIHAIEKSNIDIVNLLLENGADPNINNVGDKSTHLLTAINQAIDRYTSPDIKFKIIKALVEKGANVMTPQYDIEFTPLLIAIQEEELQIANFLLSKGANPYATVKIDESESRSPYSYLQDTIIKDLENQIERLESPSPNLLSSLEGWQKLLKDMEESRHTYSPTF